MLTRRVHSFPARFDAPSAEAAKPGLRPRAPPDVDAEAVFSTCSAMLSDRLMDAADASDRALFFDLAGFVDRERVELAWNDVVVSVIRWGDEDALSRVLTLAASFDAPVDVEARDVWGHDDDFGREHNRVRRVDAFSWALLNMPRFADDDWVTGAILTGSDCVSHLYRRIVRATPDEMDDLTARARARGGVDQNKRLSMDTSSL